ncbi:MAG: ATP-binding protein [Paludibacteraceae bacterium]|nr:ATP-binding protein [Paludibacteraceae bacterium]MBQ2608494.1 ATP-binding protein [Paludibacteraceae bacterium]
MSGGHYSLVMRNDIQQIPTLAEWIEMIGLPQELNMPINLALEEAVSNVMLYAYPGKSGQVLVECEKCQEPKGQKLVFTITDSGVPFDPTQQKDPDVTQSAEERPIGGLGIFLVRQIMDDIRYERKDDKNILTLVKKLNG